MNFKEHNLFDIVSRNEKYFPQETYMDTHILNILRVTY